MNTSRPTQKQTARFTAKFNISATSCFLTWLVFSPLTLANPTGANIVGGDAHINAAGLTTNIHQHTQNSIILNRILDINPSQINGQINANGQVIIANPNGIFLVKNPQLMSAVYLPPHSMLTHKNLCKVACVLKRLKI